MGQTGDTGSTILRVDTQTLYCIFCGAVNPLHGAYCHNCGAKLYRPQPKAQQIHEANDNDGAADRITPGMTVAQVERRLILKTLASVSNNKTRAATILGISLKTLHNKLTEYRLDANQSERHIGETPQD